MSERFSMIRKHKHRAVFGVVSLTALLTAVARPVSAQPTGVPSGPPPGAPGSPPPQMPGGPPPGFAAPPGFGDGDLPLGPPPALPLSEAQKIVEALPPPMKGGLFPVPPLGPDAAKPGTDTRDLQGVWYHNQALEVRMQKDMYGHMPPFTMEGAQVIARRVNSAAQGKPFTNASAKCLPPGPQWQRDLNFPFQIVQGENWVEFIFEEYHGRWNITLDPRAMPLPTGPEFMGKSAGKWDGTTLVVESTGFKQALWLDVDGTPLSPEGKLVQRIRKVDNGDGKPFLEIVTTVIDPKYYTNAWNIVRTFGWQPNLALFKEYNCEEQVGDPNVDADAGLVPETEQSGLRSKHKTGGCPSTKDTSV